MCVIQRMVWPLCRHNQEKYSEHCEKSPCPYILCEHVSVPHRGKCPTCSREGNSMRDPNQKSWKYHAYIPKDTSEKKLRNPKDYKSDFIKDDEDEACVAEEDESTLVV